MDGNLKAKIADIRGSIFDVRVTYDNGYTVKINGELLPGSKFIAYKKSIKAWEAPHEDEILSEEMTNKLINDVEKRNLPGTVTIIFE